MEGGEVLDKKGCKSSFFLLAQNSSGWVTLARALFDWFLKQLRCFICADAFP